MPELPDEAIEAFFLGDADVAWEQDEALADLADQVLIAVTGPAPRPSAALRAFLGEAPVVAGPLAATPPQPASPAWSLGTAPVPPTRTDRSEHVIPLFRRLRLTVGIAAATAIAAASLAVAGTTGVLPEPAMSAVSWVVEAVTPFELHTAPTRTSFERNPAPGSTSSAPDAGSRPPGPGATSEPPPVNRPSMSEPSGPPSVPGPVPPPGSVGQGRQTPTGPSMPFGPLPPAGAIPPAESGSHSTTPADRARQTPGGSSVAPTVGPPTARR